MQIKCLFLDVGGVILTNGWDRKVREKTATHFGFDIKEMTGRHEQVFDLFERGKMSFDEYLKWVLPPSAALKDVKTFVLESARAFPEMIEFVKEIKKQYNLKVCVVSNEGREIALDRIERFALKEFVDFFIVSSFVHFRKPDKDIYALALDTCQVAPHEVCYIDDRALLIETAQSLGIHCFHNVAFETTKKALLDLLHTLELQLELNRAHL